MKIHPKIHRIITTKKIILLKVIMMLLLMMMLRMMIMEMIQITDITTLLESDALIALMLGLITSILVIPIYRFTILTSLLEFQSMSIMTILDTEITETGIVGIATIDLTALTDGIDSIAITTSTIRIISMGLVSIMVLITTFMEIPTEAIMLTAHQLTSIMVVAISTTLIMFTTPMRVIPLVTETTTIPTTDLGK